MPFSPATFRFLSDLAAHNERDWFKAHKARYESEVRQPFLALLRELAPPLAELLPHFPPDPRPVGGSLFRIHRDTRFSRDKQPYKTHAGAVIRHQHGGEGAPLLYLHIDPAGCFFAAGIHHPPAPLLRRLRDFIVDNPAAWQRARDAVQAAGLAFDGERLSRAPRGYAADHPLIEDLKRKDFVVLAPLSQAQACSPELVQWLLAQAEAAMPLLDYQCAALDLAWP